jgi:hypothetical protein
MAPDENDWYGRQLREEQTSETSTVVGESDRESGSNDGTAYSDESDAESGKVVEDGHIVGAKTETVGAEKASTGLGETEAAAGGHSIRPLKTGRPMERRARNQSSRGSRVTVDSPGIYDI